MSIAIENRLFALRTKQRWSDGCVMVLQLCVFVFILVYGNKKLIIISVTFQEFIIVLFKLKNVNYYFIKLHSYTQQKKNNSISNVTI